MLFVVRQDYVSVEAINDYIINVDKKKMIGCVFNDISELMGRKVIATEQQA